MIIKFKLVLMLILLSPFLYGQNKRVNESIIYSDDLSSLNRTIESTIFLKLKLFTCFLN